MKKPARFLFPLLIAAFLLPFCLSLPALAQAEPSPVPASAEPSPAPASAEPSPAPASAEPSPVPASAEPSPAPASADSQPSSSSSPPPGPSPLSQPADLELTLDSLFVAPEHIFGVEIRRITLQEALLEALQNNPLIKARRLNPEIANAQVQAAFGRFDPTLSLSTRYSYTNTPQNAAQYIATGGTVTQTQLSLLEQLEELLAILRGQERPQPSPNQRILLQPNLYDSQNFFNRISLSGLFPLGTSYEFYLNFDELRNETNIRGLPALFYPEYSGAVGFRLSQPLLRNFGPAANLAPVALARLDRHIGWLEWRAEVERVLADVAAAYIDLALANENLLVRSDNIRLAQRLAYENQRRVLHGRMSQFDVLEALSAVKSREDDFYTASSELATRMSTFRSLISSPNSLQQWTDLRPADPIPYFPFTPNRDESRFIAFQHNPQLLIARTYIEKSDVTIRYYRNQTLPDLSIQLGLAGLSTSSSYPNSIEDSFSGQGTDFSAAVVLSIPLGNVQARAQLASAKFDRQRNVFFLQNLQNALSSEIDAICSRLLLARERISTARRAVELATRSLQSANRLLEEGRTTSFDVLRIQNSLALARLQLNSALADHAKNLIQLHLRQGTLHSYFGFTLEKEAWRDLAPSPGRRKNFTSHTRKAPLPSPSPSSPTLAPSRPLRN